MGQDGSKNADGSAKPDAANMPWDAKQVLAATRIASVWRRKTVLKRIKQLRAEKEAAATQAPAPAPEETKAADPVTAAVEAPAPAPKETQAADSVSVAVDASTGAAATIITAISAATVAVPLAPAPAPEETKAADPVTAAVEAPSPAPAPEETKAADPVTAAVEAPVSAKTVTDQQDTAKPEPVTQKPASPSASGKQQKPQQQQQQQQQQPQRTGGVRGGVRLHVKNLGPSVSTQQLRTLFQPYGRVLEAEAKAFDDGRCKGFGFVVLSNMEEANKAVAEANGTKVDGKNIMVLIVDNKLKGDKGGKKGGKGDGKGDAKGEFTHIKGKSFGKAGKGKGQPGTPSDSPAAAAAQAQQAYFQGVMPYGGCQSPTLNPYWYNYPAHAQAQVVAAHAAWWHSAYQAAAQMQMQQQWSPAGATGAAVQATDVGAQSSASQAADTTRGARNKRSRDRRGEAYAAEAALPSNFEQPKAGWDYRGTLKSLSDKHGYGFIFCEEAKQMYDRDVWVDSDALPENAKVGARLLFNMTLSPKGHPQAQNVRMAR